MLQYSLNCGCKSINRVVLLVNAYCSFFFFFSFVCFVCVCECVCPPLFHRMVQCVV